MLKKLALAAALMAASFTTAVAEPVKLGLQPWLGYGPLWVAEQKGFFAKHGVEVQLTTFNWDQDMTAALASGNLHVIAAATNGIITNFNQGVDQKGFLVMDLSFEADAVVAGSAIGTIPELKGKKVAFEAGTTSDLLINYALKENGLTIADFPPLPSAGWERVAEGRVRALCLRPDRCFRRALIRPVGHLLPLLRNGRRGLVVAELVAASEGLGRRIMDAQRYLATDTILFGTLFIGLMGLLTDYLFKKSGRALFRWNNQSR
jgi:hypothetical protein